ncbi:MAG TPA: hypothetical protein PK880_01935 [Candidatus Competibacter sp.]|nr:hypothetical protein [Candidatus Competibacteraceae bacterium]HRC71275.1 hypothetical protein [Candidatus Competibacter sp.]
MTVRILLAKDQPSIAEIVGFALACEGFQMAWLTLARDAEAELQRRAYDLIVSDIGLPDGSGPEPLKRRWAGINWAMRRTAAVTGRSAVMALRSMPPRVDEVPRLP